MPKGNTQEILHPLAAMLLKWYQRHAREMPWRVVGGAHPDPYMVWISEIMLQQTTVRTVMSYFDKWMHLFPNIKTLAEADIQDVLLAWQGLGYYTRAKKIHECARVLISQYNGKIPGDRFLLLKLPGIGPYTASSICAFGFNQPETVVDGNVIRVIARIYGLKHIVTKEEIYNLASKLTPLKHGADYASAIMDLGALVCTPTNPNCFCCPWKDACLAFRDGLTASIPMLEKQKKKVKKGCVYLIQNMTGSFYIQKRQGKGLLSGLYEFPWFEGEMPPFDAAWQYCGHVVKHTFTHFQLILKIIYLKVDQVPLTEGFFVHPSAFHKYPFSSLMRKIRNFIEKS